MIFNIILLCLSSVLALNEPEVRYVMQSWQNNPKKFKWMYNCGGALDSELTVRVGVFKNAAEFNDAVTNGDSTVKSFTIAATGGNCVSDHNTQATGIWQGFTNFDGYFFFVSSTTADDSYVSVKPIPNIQQCFSTKPASNSFNGLVSNVLYQGLRGRATCNSGGYAWFVCSPESSTWIKTEGWADCGDEAASDTAETVSFGLAMSDSYCMQGTTAYSGAHLALSKTLSSWGNVQSLQDCAAAVHGDSMCSDTFVSSIHICSCVMATERTCVSVLSTSGNHIYRLLGSNKPVGTLIAAQSYSPDIAAFNTLYTGSKCGSATMKNKEDLSLQYCAQKVLEDGECSNVFHHNDATNACACNIAAQDENGAVMNCLKETNSALNIYKLTTGNRLDASVVLPASTFNESEGNSSSSSGISGLAVVGICLGAVILVSFAVYSYSGKAKVTPSMTSTPQLSKHGSVINDNALVRRGSVEVSVDVV